MCKDVEFRLKGLVAVLFIISWGAVVWANNYPPTPTSHFYGDADGNTIVGGIDIIQVNNYILNKSYTFDTLQPANPFDDWNTCDINSDRQCSGLDFILLNNYVLNKPVIIDAMPWTLGNDPLAGGLPLTGNTPELWIPFSINLSSAHPVAGQSGRPGVSVIAEINAGSPGTGFLSGRACAPNPGLRDQLAALYSQCALAVTITDWNAAPDHGDTESGPYGFAIYSNGDGDLILNIRIEANPALDIPAATLNLNVSFNSPECSDGVDNDGDTLTDWPADLECFTPSDPSETFSPPACNDGFDNDGDTFTDYPNDPECFDLTDPDESDPSPPECSDNWDNDGDGLIDYPADSGCDNPTDWTEYVAECGDYIDNDGDTYTDWNEDSECGGPLAPSESYPIPPFCNDSFDNDGDTLIDYPADPGCAASQSWSEQDPPECLDGADNDGDTLADYPADPECNDLADPSESDASAPQCSDTLDNDWDSLTDFPNDPDCAGPNDWTEAALPECSDWIDNDGDTLIDWPVDFGCFGPLDTSEL